MQSKDIFVLINRWMSNGACLHQISVGQVGPQSYSGFEWEMYAGRWISVLIGNLGLISFRKLEGGSEVFGSRVLSEGRQGIYVYLWMKEINWEEKW